MEKPKIEEMSVASCQAAITEVDRRLEEIDSNEDEHKDAVDKFRAYCETIADEELYGQASRILDARVKAYEKLCAQGMIDREDLKQYRGLLVEALNDLVAKSHADSSAQTEAKDDGDPLFCQAITEERFSDAAEMALAKIGDSCSSGLWNMLRVKGIDRTIHTALMYCLRRVKEE